MKIIVGCIIVEDDSFVVVQEKRESVYGKWSLPLGQLEKRENILSGAKRESEEETGLKINVDGFVGIYQHEDDKNGSVMIIIFKASAKEKELNCPKEEILDAKWITFEDFNKIPKEDIRAEEIIKIVHDYESRGSLSLEYFKNLLGD